MIKPFLLGILLILSGVAGVIECIRLLKLSQLRSLLAWHSLVFITVTTPAVIIVSYGELPHGFILGKSEEVTIEFILAGMLINLIIIAYSFFERKFYLKSSLKSEFGKAKLIYSDRFRLRHLFLFVIMAMGIPVFLSFETSQYVLGNIRDIFLIPIQPGYYEFRTEQLFSSRSNFEIYLEIFIFNIILPLFNLYASFCWKNNRNRLWLLFWLVSLIIWILYALMTLEKGPLLAVAISNIALRVFMEERKIQYYIRYLKTAKFYIYAFSVVTVIFGIYYLSGYKDNIISEFLDRTFVVTGYGAYAHYLVFPDIHPYLYYYGSATTNLLLGLGQDTSFSTRFTSPAFLSALFSTGSVYSMNSSILGDGWANYGFLGVFQCAVVLFGILVFWDIYLRKKKSKLPLLPLVAFFLGKTYQIFNGDLLFMITKGGLIVAPLVYIYLARGGKYYYGWRQ